MHKFTSRKFYLAVGGIVLVSALYIFFQLSEPTFRDCFIACIVSYSAANVFASKNRE